ncbi:MAG: hypothetical protein JXP73_12125 [Deltaproteobacteria bacterium]|nr:hypothetical protein [Deltaproteobacteria bacterium]
MVFWPATVLGRNALLLSSVLHAPAAGLFEPKTGKPGASQNATIPMPAVLLQLVMPPPAAPAYTPGALTPPAPPDPSEISTPR